MPEELDPKVAAGFDPNIRLPESVRRAAAAAEKHYQTPAPTEEVTAAVSEAPSTETPPAQEAAPPPPAPPAPPAPPQEDHTAPPTRAELTSDVWAQRYNSMRGRYEQSQRTIGGLQEQLQEMSNELVAMQRQIGHQQPQQQPQQAQQQTQRLVTPEDEQTYGPEIIDLVRRAAKEVTAPEIENLKAETQRVKQHAAQQQMAELYTDLAKSVPEWRTVNTDPRFAQWLSKRDIYSGHIRQQMLNEALRAASAPRVIAFFKGFLSEETATGNAPAGETPPPTPTPRPAAVPLATLAAPGKARSASEVPTDKPSFTRAQIAQFYRDVRAGAYAGRQPDKDRTEKQIFAAQNEGRVH